jgi:hypothetical protein
MCTPKGYTELHILPHETHMFIELAARDLELRERLIGEGKLFGGYNPEMEVLHIANGQILQQYIRDKGWPKDEDESKAAWLVLVHSISMPELQQQALEMLQREETGVPASMVAMLEDRVLTLRGGKQKYGTQFDWDESGELNLMPIEDPEQVDLLRAGIGLESIEERTAFIRARAVEEGETAMEDRDQYLLERLHWMKKVGWIDNIEDVDPAYKPSFMRAH